MPYMGGGSVGGGAWETAGWAPSPCGAREKMPLPLGKPRPLGRDPTAGGGGVGKGRPPPLFHLPRSRLVGLLPRDFRQTHSSESLSGNEHSPNIMVCPFGIHVVAQRLSPVQGLPPPLSKRTDRLPWRAEAPFLSGVGVGGVLLAVKLPGSFSSPSHFLPPSPAQPFSRLPLCLASLELFTLLAVCLAGPECLAVPALGLAPWCPWEPCPWRRVVLGAGGALPGRGWVPVALLRSPPSACRCDQCQQPSGHR